MQWIWALEVIVLRMCFGNPSVYCYHRRSLNKKVQCGTNNISTESLRDIADCIVDVGTVFRKKSNTVNIIICGLIPCDECWSVNRLLINKVNDILKYDCHKNGFAFIVQDHGWILSNGPFDCFPFYEDSLHLVKKGNVKLAKSIVSTVTAQNNLINSRSKIVTHYIVMFLNNPFQLLFLFPLWRMIFLHWPVFVSLPLNLETVVTMSLLEVSLFRLLLVNM